MKTSFLEISCLFETVRLGIGAMTGRGRTTTFMVLYDILRNATRVSLENIMRRQQFFGYDYDVLRSADAGSWKAPYTGDRIAFVRAFYNYARANPNGRPQLWSDWLNSTAN